MKLDINLSSTWCNNWPTCQVMFNNQQLFFGLVEKPTNLTFDLCVNDTNTLKVFMLNKQFGPRLWNTKVVDNVIVQDQSLTIEKIEFDEVDVKLILNQQPMNVLDRENYNNHGCNFYYNSYLELTFTNPIYNWIITEKYIRNNQTSTDVNSFGSWNNKFNYSATKTYLDKLKELL